MRLANTNLVFRRELRDQLRDRRTLFTIVVLPLLLYPLMGMGMMHVAQFMQKTPTTILIAGAEYLTPQYLSGIEKPDPAAEDPNSVEPHFFVGDSVNPALLGDGEQELTQFKIATPGGTWDGLLEASHRSQDDPEQSAHLRQQMALEGLDLAVLVLPKSTGIDAQPDCDIILFSNSASDKSKLAANRINSAIFKWRSHRLERELREKDIDLGQLQIVQPVVNELSSKKHQRASFWSKILPFVIMIWALTGAFYPAIDLCAGEKERGTLETLLCSPAKRSEIVAGKMLTTMLFSMTTSVLNLISMAFTGLFVAKQLGGSGAGALGAIGPPPISAMFWLLIALVPISALFSALSIAVASFARSSKEGQYYLMPLIMIAMPLVMLPMLPSSTLNIGTSLIPLSGLMLLLRALIEGHYTQALAFAGPVCMVTVTCCWFAARWAIGQFDNESVLFRASDRVGVGSLVRLLIRERQATPFIGHAIMCGLLILIFKFFLSISASPQLTWLGFTKTTLVTLVATVLMPTILMALVLTKNPLRSLKLDNLGLRAIPIGIFLAFCLHPAFSILSRVVLEIYPPAAEVSAFQSLFDQIIADSPGLWAVILLMAVAPALAEEFAYRGFILTGLQRIKNAWWPILISSLLFGAAHAVIQQSIITFFIGILLAILAVKSKSLLPCMAYHVTHNTLSIVISGMHPSTAGRPWIAGLMQQTADGGMQYSLLPSILMTTAGMMIIIWIWFGGLNQKSNSNLSILPLRKWFARATATSP